jgi:hypothetical protein
VARQLVGRVGPGALAARAIAGHPLALGRRRRAIGLDLAPPRRQPRQRHRRRRRVGRLGPVERLGRPLPRGPRHRRRRRQRLDLPRAVDRRRPRRRLGRRRRLQLALPGEPAVARPRLPGRAHLRRQRLQAADVRRLGVEVAQRRVQVVDRRQRLQHLGEHLAVGRRQQPLEQRAEVARGRDDLAVRLGHAPEADRLGVGRLRAEQPRRHLAAEPGQRREHRRRAQPSAQRLAVARAIVLVEQRDLGQRPRRREAPAPHPRVERRRLGAQADRQRPPGRGVAQLERRVGDGAAGPPHAALGVEPQHHALQAAALVAPSAQPRRSVPLQLAAGQHVVDRVEHRGLARAVVAQQEQVPAAAQLDGLVDEVVDVDQPHALDLVRHGPSSSPSAPSARATTSGASRRGS